MIYKNVKRVGELEREVVFMKQLGNTQIILKIPKGQAGEYEEIDVAWEGSEEDELID
jgi:hypothetical protein